MQELELLEDYNESRAFHKYPDGFYINSQISSKSFFSSVLNSYSKKLKLALLSPIHPIVKLPSSSNTEAVREQNDALLVWEKSLFYKIPLNEKSKQRILSEKKAISKLSHTSLKKFLPNNMYLKEFVKGPRMTPVKVNEVSLLDNFLYEYFYLAKESTFIHGDFHINQLYLHGKDIKIVDWDMLQEGPSSIDILSFFVHYIGFYYLKDYFSALNELINDPEAFTRRAIELGFSRSADLIDVAFLRDFLNQRLQWCDMNQTENDFKANLQQALSNYESR